MATTTKQAYLRTWEKYTHFSKTILGNEPQLPIQSQDLVLFVAYLNQNNASASIASSMSALGHLHKLAGLEDVTKHFLVTQTLAGARKVASTCDTRLPITATILKELVNAIPKVTASSAEARLFKAMFVTAFFGFLRIGEMAPTTKKQVPSVIQFSDLHWQNDKSQVVVTLRKFKHSVKRGPQNVVLRKETSANSDICPVRGIRKFLRVRGPHRGPLFILDGKPCLRRKFDRVLKDCVEFCRYDIKAYKGHSFRIGAATDAAARGFSDAQIRTLGRWNSDAFRRYIRLSSAPSSTQQFHLPILPAGRPRPARPMP